LVDGEEIKDPVFAVAIIDFKKFINEIECLAFLTECEIFAEEIFVNKVLFTIHIENITGFNEANIKLIGNIP